MEQIKMRYLELVRMLEQKQQRYPSASQYEARELAVAINNIKQLINLHETMLNVNEM